MDNKLDFFKDFADFMENKDEITLENVADTVYTHNGGATYIVSGLGDDDILHQFLKERCTIQS